jgi:hypothetical protein
MFFKKYRINKSVKNFKVLFPHNKIELIKEDFHTLSEKYSDQEGQYLSNRICPIAKALKRILPNEELPGLNVCSESFISNSLRGKMQSGLEDVLKCVKNLNKGKKAYIKITSIEGRN